MSDKCQCKSINTYCEVPGHRPDGPEDHRAPFLVRQGTDSKSLCHEAKDLAREMHHAPGAW